MRTKKKEAIELSQSSLRSFDVVDRMPSFIYGVAVRDVIELIIP
jgi:hypothetical protein